MNKVFLIILLLLVSKEKGYSQSINPAKAIVGTWIEVSAEMYGKAFDNGTVQVEYFPDGTYLYISKFKKENDVRRGAYDLNKSVLTLYSNYERIAKKGNPFDSRFFGQDKIRFLSSNTMECTTIDGNCVVTYNRKR